MMPDSSISKLFASALTIPQELTLTAANVNLDFTLIRMVPPQEYAGAGVVLTPLRRQNAETGGLHRTARKLGALFEGKAPPSRELLRAYGLRVSEICKEAEAHTKENKGFGLFTMFSGTDIAGLWAAATSGTNAIAVHLLACLIAEALDGPKAVSLWVELIQYRKRELLEQCQDEMDQLKKISMDIAANQELSREELAQWDNSARSWIRTANTVKSKERRQVLLCTDTLGLHISTSAEDAYNGAMSAWVDAISAMELLIKGTPQRVRTGAIILAITAWHIYPDLTVLSKGPGVIQQNDPLVPPSGILTIDVEKGEAGTGIVWSLPLAYMRYYGEPVKVTQTLGIDTNRVSMDEFAYVLIGCVISTWLDFRVSEKEALKLLSRLVEALRMPDRDGKDTEALQRMQKIMARSSWIGQLLSAVEDYEDADPTDKEMAIRLIRHGHRNAEFLCDSQSHPPPFFGLCEIKPLFAMMTGAEPRIAYLRQMAMDLKLSPENCVVRYTYAVEHITVIEYATIGGRGTMTNENGFLLRKPTQPDDSRVNYRWISIVTKVAPCKCGEKCRKPDSGTAPAGLFKLRRKTCPCWNRGGCSIACHNWQKAKDQGNFCESLHAGILRQRIDDITKLGERCLPVHAMEDAHSPFNGMLDFGVGNNFFDSVISLSKGKSLE